jgi:hypothetical protein
VNLVDVVRDPLRAAFKLFARSCTYRAGMLADVPLMAFIRGVRADDLFGSAMQQDVAAVLDAADFAAAFPARPKPMRFDRLISGSRSYSVEEWRGSPNDDAPVFFKLLLRGGDQ